ncbi:MAG: glycosyltransferase family 4 protein [Actinobacteria bacterium]|nr:glycosyltransferase family 4 protein [Actinomycetota bacterium]
MPTALFVTNDFGPRAGGIETFLMGLVARLPPNSVTVYTSAQGNTEAYDQKWLADFGVRVIRDRSKILLPSPRVARALRNLLKRESFAVACFGAALPLGLLAATLRRAGIPRVVSLSHGHEVWWAKVFPFTLAVRAVGANLDALSYLGEFTHRAMAKSLSKSAQTAMVRIAPGIDAHHFSPSAQAAEVREQLGLTNKKVIVSVGRLVHRKGQDRLVEALPKIIERVSNAHLLIIGEGPHRKVLEKLVAKNHVESAVTFIGRLQYEDLPRYIGAADVFAMPSRARFFGLEVEGLGIVYLEASACGLPVVAGDKGGAPDAVIEGETGLAVDGTSIDAISKAIVDLLQDPAKAKQMGQRGREWVVDQWSWEYWSSQFADFLYGMDKRKTN